MTVPCQNGQCSLFTVKWKTDALINNIPVNDSAQLEGHLAKEEEAMMTEETVDVDLAEDRIIVLGTTMAVATVEVTMTVRMTRSCLSHTVQANCLGAQCSSGCHHRSNQAELHWQATHDCCNQRWQL